MWLLLVVFTINFIAIQMVLTPQQISDQGVQVLFFFGQQLAGNWASYIMVFAVLTSTVATTQTTLLPAARISYAMSRDGVFPKVFGTVHPKFRTPALGTLVLSLIALFGIILTTLSTQANTVFNELVTNLGVLVAFYYGITGLACAWAFRKTWGKGLKANLTMIVAPLIGGVTLLFVCGYVIKSAGAGAKWDEIILGLGLPLLAIAYFTSKGKTDFFKQPIVAYEEIDDELEVSHTPSPY
jgi:amino acid transporter